MTALSTDVLVIGAGPAGLSAAIAAKHNAPQLQVYIVDAKTIRDPGSKAIIMYPGTMEVVQLNLYHSLTDSMTGATFS
jgi:flavin-dependent dehydrogenase